MTIELIRRRAAAGSDPVPRPRAAAARGRAARLVRGRPEDPRWVRPTLLGLLAATALLYLWDLSASGWANSFYAAAVQAGAKSWEAFFYGSSDAANSITVDKPPASLWVMGLSARLFGLSSWSLLVPEALMGVGSVGLLYVTVRRWYGAAAGLLAGAALALTPVAVLMFRFDNPDAMLVLLLIAAVYAMQRAIESGSTRWVAAVGALIGFGFLTKMLQALLIVPGLAVVFLIAGPGGLLHRIRQVFVGLAALLAATGWWVAIVEIVPAADRPYIGGSQHNSILELVLGYNGLGRLSGNETGSVGAGSGGPGGGGMWGPTGWLRMFNADNGSQVAWLIPAALLLGALALWRPRRAARTDRTRAGLLLWGSWLLVTMGTFSFMKGIYHPYYTVALAPAVAAVVAIGAVLAWRNRRQRSTAVALAAAVALTVWWSERLLARSPGFQSWLHPTLWVLGGLAVLALLGNNWLPRRAVLVAATVAVGVGLAGPAAYAVQTAGQPHSGSLPTAGPAGQGSRGGPRGFGPGGSGRGGFGGGGGNPAGGFTRRGTAGTTGRQSFGGFPSGGFPSGGFAGGGFGGGRGGGGGGMGGLLDGSQPGTALTALLKAGAAGHTWVAATVGSNSASGYQLATGDPVMPIGGFNGSDPSPTLAQFKADVTAGKIHYFIGGGGFGNQMGGSQAANQIASWVEANFTSQAVDGVTLYDLTTPTTTAATAAN
jgi:4-amino-4-deoxy-L-arabinose transferase-like glycosyltransferase